MTHRRARIAIVCALASFVAAGCSSSSGGGSAPGSASSLRGQTITVDMEGGDQSTTALQQLLPQFEKASGIKVKFDSIPYDNLTSQVLLALSHQSSTPDVIFDDWAYGREFARSGYIDPLNSYATADTKYVKLSDFYAPYLNTMKVGSSYYGLPVYGETTLLQYRKDLFQKYGISRPPATMQQLAADAATIYQKSGHKTYGITMRGAPGIQSVYVYAGFLRAFGGDWYTKAGKPNVDSPAAIKSAAFWANLLRQSGPQAAANYDYFQNQTFFDKGGAAMTIDASALGGLNEDASQSSIAGKVGYAPVPYAAGQSPGGSNSDHSLEVHGMYLSHFSTHKQAAWEFMSWATSPSVQLQELRISPQPGLTSNAALNSPTFTKKYRAFAAVMKSELKTGNPNYLPSGTDSNEMVTDVGQALNSVLAGQQSAASALRQAQQEITSSSSQ
jgi:multiple sugar transport system substrate-binding protein